MPKINISSSDIRTSAAPLRDDVLRFNILDDEPITQNLGSGNDAVVTSAGPGTREVRLTFTSSEVGNGRARDSDTQDRQDGGLAVRMRAEGNSGALTGATSRFDDEGITFLSNGDFKYDVRDLVSGVARGSFDSVQLGTSGADIINKIGKASAFYINGGAGADNISGSFRNDFLVGGRGFDTLDGRKGDDTLLGGAGDDELTGGQGNDTVIYNISTDGNDTTDLGAGSDTVNVSAATGTSQVRVTFTSAEVGNGLAVDGNALTNQDGGLAVRLQGEAGDDSLAGAIGRYDDEGVTFESDGNFTFDVRDLVSGVQRGASFDTVQLGTSNADVISKVGESDNYYVNAGTGDDQVTGGFGNDFLVGGAGADSLSGRLGNDSLLGGGGDDSIIGGEGNDVAIFNASTDGSDTVDLGNGQDTVNVTAAAGTTQIRLTFTSAEVGNGVAADSNTLTNQDGGLAVRLQLEDGSDSLVGGISRFDDEGVTFISATPGATFDVRDLVSGAARGNLFEAVTLGTAAADTINETGETRAYYVNAGAGDDMVTGGLANDFLVGGAGNDMLNGQEGVDSLLGGAGADTFVFAGETGNDTVVDFVSGTDKIDLSDYGITFDDITFANQDGDTLVNVNTTGDAEPEFQIRLQNAAAPVQSDFLFA